MIRDFARTGPRGRHRLSTDETRTAPMSGDSEWPSSRTVTLRGSSLPPAQGGQRLDLLVVAEGQPLDEVAVLVEVPAELCISKTESSEPIKIEVAPATDLRTGICEADEMLLLPSLRVAAWFPLTRAGNQEWFRLKRADTRAPRLAAHANWDTRSWFGRRLAPRTPHCQGAPTRTPAQRPTNPHMPRCVPLRTHGHAAVDARICR